MMFTGLPASRVIPPILHYSAGEPFTKYEMCLVFARLLGVPHGHINADASTPKVCLLLHFALSSTRQRLRLLWDPWIRRLILFAVTCSTTRRDRRTRSYMCARRRTSWRALVDWDGTRSKNGGLAI